MFPISDRLFHVDANLVNSRQAIEPMNQLEDWNRRGLICLEWPRTAYQEAGRGNQRRQDKADDYTWAEPNDSFDVEELRHQIELAVFPKGAQHESDWKDIENLLTAKMAGAAFITRDGLSKSQPRGILGSAEALAKLGIYVLTPEEAVAQVANSLGACKTATGKG